MQEELGSGDERFQVGAVWGGRYLLKRLLGSGGAATVFAAEHVFVKRPVALKLPHVDVPEASAGFARLRREMETLARIRHPGVVDIVDGGDVDGIPFIAMHLLDGRSLSGLIAARGRLDADEVTKIGAELAWTMTAVHESGVLHRDIKPANVLISADPRNQSRLLDFGTAKIIGQGLLPSRKLTLDGALLGTLEYMAPESILSPAEADHRADIYALGVTLFECLTGVVPFEGSIGQILLRFSAAEWPSLHALRPDLPPRLTKAIDRSFQRNASDRQPTMAELAAELSACAPKDAEALDVLNGRLRTKAPARAEDPHTAPPAADIASKREHARAPYVALALILVEGGTPSYGRVEDLSEGGALIVGNGMPGVGATSRIRFALPVSGRVVELDGRTRWSRSTRGVRVTGFEFADLPGEARAEIREYVVNAQKQGGSTRNRMRATNGET